VPFTVIIEAIDQLDVGELRLLAQHLEQRLASWSVEQLGT